MNDRGGSTRMKTFLPIVALLLVASCSRSSEPQLTTSTSTTTSTTTNTTTTTTTVQPEAEPVTTYDVVVRTSTEKGEILWVVIPPGDYNEISLEGLIATVIDDAGVPVWEIHVFDDPAALEAARVEEGQRTEEEQRLVDEHYLVSLVQGNVVRFQGPFASSGEFVFGS